MEALPTQAGLDQQEAGGRLGHPLAEACVVFGALVLVAAAYTFRVEILDLLLGTLLPSFAQHLAL